MQLCMGKSYREKGKRMKQLRRSDILRSHQVILLGCLRFFKHATTNERSVEGAYLMLSRDIRT
uniref:Uncharacterized protein n=1 Tax=Rhizophora mucronata TaxID=61149 RepID=A0A2P2J3X1_RHIMU